MHTSEENDNTALRAIVATFRALAAEFDIAVILAHNTRKGEITLGDPDSARGASAIIGAARIVKTLVTMSEKDAESFNIDASRKIREQYARLHDAKQNYAGINDPEWFQTIVHHLDNGEAVAAVVPWSPPDKWKSIPFIGQITPRLGEAEPQGRH